MATDLLQECTKFKGKVELNSILQYSRGSGVQEIEHDDISVLHKVFTRMNLNCRSPIEIPDYNTNHEPLCFHCASINILSEDSPEFQDKYPICKPCFSDKKPLISKRKRTTPSTMQKEKILTTFHILYH